MLSPRRVPVRVAAGLLLLGLLAAACARPDPAARGPAAAPAPAAPPTAAPPGRPAAERPLVLTTILPVQLFTQAVAEGCATVEPLSPEAADPHHGHARPGDLARLGQARVLVENGLGLEAPLEKGISAAAGPDLVRIQAARPVTPLRGADGEPNPHVWLDPQRAVQQVEAIRDGLSAADPGCRDRYAANADAFIGRLRQLDAELAARLAPFAGRRFVVSHDLAPYLAARYRLRSEPLVAIPHQPPSPADLQRVAAVVRGDGLRAVLVEPGAEEGDLQTLARDLNLRLLVLDPLEVAPAAAPPAPDHYLSTMRRNATALVNAFGG